MKKYVPWNNDDLKAMLEEIVSNQSEGLKIDYKSEFLLETRAQKSELMKDIQAKANTDDEHYDDFGFIILGAKPGEICGLHVAIDTDHLQSEVEQLVRSNIYPDIPFQIKRFETDGRHWAVIVIPPSSAQPHMFFEDYSCDDPKFFRKKGEWFVRRGTTTDKGLPEDLVRIFDKRLNRNLEPLRDSVKTLQLQIGRMEEQNQTAIAATFTNAKPDGQSNESVYGLGNASGLDLAARLKQKLKTPQSRLADDLIAEAQKLRSFLEAVDNKLSWAPQLTNEAENKAYIEYVEEISQSYLKAVAVVALYDDKKELREALLKSLAVLAKMFSPPDGTSYNGFGMAVRYYPLLLTLYIIFICGVHKGDAALLRATLDVPLKGRDRRSTTRISHTAWFVGDAFDFFRHAFANKLCAPIATRARQTVVSILNELIGSDENEYFYRGEFVFSLSGIDSSFKEGHTGSDVFPLPGMYLYHFEADAPIKELLASKPKWLSELYELEKTLTAFDQNSRRAVSPSCIALGVHEGTLAAHNSS